MSELKFELSEDEARLRVRGVAMSSISDLVLMRSHELSGHSLEELCARIDDLRR